MADSLAVRLEAAAQRVAHYQRYHPNNPYVVHWAGAFYFIDETDNFVGPYETDGDAAEALDRYCRWLDGTRGWPR